MFLILFTAIWLVICYYLCTKRSNTVSNDDSSSKSCSQDELSEKSLLATKKDELDASSRQWKSRVEKSDAEKFSVAGKMSERIRDATPTINIKDVDENEKRTPQAKRFKLKGRFFYQCKYISCTNKLNNVVKKIKRWNLRLDCIGLCRCWKKTLNWVQ